MEDQIEIHQEDHGSKKQGNVASKDGTLLTDSENVKERWREYIEELYAKDEKRTFIPLELEEEVDIDSIGPDLLREGIRQLADWLVLFVCFNLAVASGLFCSGLGKRASQTRAANHTPPPPLSPRL